MKLKVLYDINILMDALFRRKPHDRQSVLALDAAMSGKVAGCIAAHAVPTIAYFCGKETDSKTTNKLLQDLLVYLSVLPVTETTIRQALNLAPKDFEDELTYVAALEAGVQVIITRNPRDFPKEDIKVMIPEVFNTPR